MRVETRVKARVADVRTYVASERDQIEVLRRKPLAQMTSEFNPAHPRQGEVHHDAIGLEGVHKHERTRTVAGDSDLVPPRAGQTGDRRPDLFVIVDDQYSSYARCHDNPLEECATG